MLHHEINDKEQTDLGSTTAFHSTFANQFLKVTVYTLGFSVAQNSIMVGAEEKQQKN